MKWIVTFAIISLLEVFAYNSALFHRLTKGRGSFQLQVNGKRKDEIGLSKKAIFRQFRSRLQEAAKKPGFFDDEIEEPAEVEFYRGRFVDGSAKDCCPYSQFVQLVLGRKNVKYDLLPLNVTGIKRSVSFVLKHQNVSLCDPLDTAEYLERMFPDPSLAQMGTYSYQEIIEKTSKFFPSLRKLVVNRDPALDPPLKAEFLHQVDIIDHLIRTSPGKYVGGVELTFADLFLLPQLYQAMVAAERFKDVVFYHVESDFTRPALEYYLSRMLSFQPFQEKRVFCPADKLVRYWKLEQQRHADNENSIVDAAQLE